MVQQYSISKIVQYSTGFLTGRLPNGFQQSSPYDKIAGAAVYARGLLAHVDQPELSNCYLALTDTWFSWPFQDYEAEYSTRNFTAGFHVWSMTQSDAMLHEVRRYNS